MNLNNFRRTGCDDKKRRNNEMFCPKCGMKSIDGGVFCQKCGARLVVDEARQSALAATLSNQEYATGHDNKVNMPKKGKKGKILFFLGMLVLAVLAIVIVFCMWVEKIDYVAVVKGCKPLEETQGLDITYADVFDRYMKQQDWEVRESGDIHYVDINGAIKGTGYDLAVTFKVSPDPDDDDILLVDLESVVYNEEKFSTINDAANFLVSLFSAYNEGYKDLSEMLSDMEPQEINLSETYVNDEEGISFHYPSDWMMADTESEFCIVSMIDSQNNADRIASLEIWKSFEDNPWEVFTGDEESVKKAVNNEFLTFLKYEECMIGDIPAKCVTAKRKVLKRGNIVKSYIYAIEGSVYKINCSYSMSSSEIYEPLFDAIMDTCSITSPVPKQDLSTGQIFFKGVPIDTIFHLRWVDVYDEFGLSAEELESDTRLYTSELGVVDTIEILNLSDLTIDGIGLNTNREGLAALMGEPSSEEHYGSGHYIYYQFPDYSICFELFEMDGDVWKAIISASI